MVKRTSYLASNETFRVQFLVGVLEPTADPDYILNAIVWITNLVGTLLESGRLPVRSTSLERSSVQVRVLPGALTLP
jgi:hypothetical protein